MDATETRPLTAAGRRIADAAEELFYERGITGVGVDLIAEHSGVTKRTLYNQFGSKDHLVAVYLTERDRRWRSLVLATVDASATPRDAVLAPFEALATWSATNTRGCAFINALAELPDPAHPAHHIATAQKIWLLDLFETLAAAADCPAPTSLARQLLLLHEGALATQPLRLDTLTEATALARSLIISATPH
ncbi:MULTISPECIES: TetR/AcrR family transcriptional regulator [Streptomyces]|uniref:Transcriptional regulator n=1 Tax=Streptomyces griseus TaxID=1911 RepID=A0A380P442_STRGR|nr:MULTISPECIES: TetR/AcrR family transcriptional regulator [Streptomyces]NEE27339.1 TetR/AcrR family transcriptional regulator [Streptomyces sp. SID7982]RPK87283.1 HTH-type transcriptional regulator YjdC [Streptomyces sp. ADI98-12]SUP59970.1 Transcriptional regulator [Streptomyces griseus]